MATWTNSITGRTLNNVRDPKTLSSTELNAMYQATNGGSLGGNRNSNVGVGTVGAGVSAVKKTQQATSGGGSSSSGGGGSSYSGGSGYAGGGVDYSGYLSQLAALYAQQQAQAQALAAQQRAAAESAYRAGMDRLNQAWDTKSGALKSNYDSTLSNLARQYAASKNEVNADANKSLREAYVNHMLNRKNLNQNLSAQGIGGGAAESTMAGMYNNYGNSRNNINTTLNDNLTSLENLYQGNVASAEQQYNSNYADAMSNYLAMQNQMEQNLASNIIGSYNNMINSLGNLNSGYTDTLYSLLNKQAEYGYMPTMANNSVQNVSTQSLNNMGSVTDYAKAQAMYEQMAAQGMNQNAIAQELKNRGATANMLYQLFNV